MTMTRASSESALAISTICWSAIERPRAIRSGSRRTPKRAKMVETWRAWPCGRCGRPLAEGLAAHEHVLRHREVGEQGGLLVDDGDARRRGAAAGADSVVSWPPIRSVPLSGWWTPARIFTRVDLPAPFSPDEGVGLARRRARGSRPRAPGRRRRTWSHDQARVRARAVAGLSSAWPLSNLPPPPTAPVGRPAPSPTSHLPRTLGTKPHVPVGRLHVGPSEMNRFNPGWRLMLGLW